MSAWFAGPKGENSDWFGASVLQILQDYYYWRRNYFPEDGVVVDSNMRRHQEGFRDCFDDKLFELLGRLKADFPFHSPRYVGHMLAEQTLPSIAGYFAAMLYNPNNVSADAAPVTVQLEIEAAQMIARMSGHDDTGWAHLTSGGTVAGFEALWMARTVKYLPIVVAEMRTKLGLSPSAGDIRVSPSRALAEFANVFREVGSNAPLAIKAYLDSEGNVVERGMAALERRLGSRPIVLAPESHHYCFHKAMDLLGMGRRALVEVRVDSEFRMRVDDLATKIDELEAGGNHVLAVIAVVGTTEEGAVDPVDEILSLRKRRETMGQSSFWLHADAAYGGYLRTLTLPRRIGLGPRETKVKVGGQVRTLELALPEHSACDALEPMGECDSIAIDPHKLGYIPYPAGAICFKSNLVKPLARQEAPYLEEHAVDLESERTSERVGVYALEGSKPGAAAAAVWLSHKLIPLDSTGHGALIQETVRNASELYGLLCQYPEMTAAGPVRAVPLCVPGSNIVCYAFRPVRDATLVEVNRLNQRLYERFSLSDSSRRRVYDQRFFASRTTLSPSRYSVGAVSPFLERLKVSQAEYEEHGVFLLRSVLMNPWFAEAKAKGRYFLSEFVDDLYTSAAELIE